LWVFQAEGPVLNRFALEPSPGPLLRLDRDEPLPAAAGSAFVGLADGSFVLAEARQLVRLHPGGKRTTLRQLSGEPQRLFKSSRIDRVWVLYDHGRMELVQLGTRLLVVERKQWDAPPFDVATGGSRLATITLEQTQQGRRWWLEIFDETLQRQRRLELPPDPSPSAGDDWVERLTANRGLSVSPDGHWVAVGGPTALTLWQGTGPAVAIPARKNP
jgi:hypothetical protein